MARYTPCSGWKQEPERIYKPVRHRLLYNGRKHRDPGFGLCRSCQRVTAILDDKDGRSYVGRHAPKRQSFDTRKKAHWEAYERLGGYGAPRLNAPRDLTGYAPMWVQQNVTMTNATVPLMYGNSMTQYVPTGTGMGIELTSDTRNAQGQYVFNINGAVYVSPDRRMRLVTNHAVWNNWNNSLTVSANTITTTWQNWNHFQPGYNYAVQQPRRPAYDQVARAEDLFRRVERDVEREARAEAALRAKETLLELLTEEQQAEYLERNHFHVRGSRGTLYRIKHGSSGNIRRVRSREDEGREEAAFCVHSVNNTSRDVADDVGIVAGYLPHEDHMIQQMLHLMIDEDEILAKANVHWGTRQPAADYEVRESGLLLAHR